jgi:hypothetical protein
LAAEKGGPYNAGDGAVEAGVASTARKQIGATAVDGTTKGRASARKKRPRVGRHNLSSESRVTSASLWDAGAR